MNRRLIALTLLAGFCALILFHSPLLASGDSLLTHGQDLQQTMPGDKDYSKAYFGGGCF